MGGPRSIKKAQIKHQNPHPSI